MEPTLPIPNRVLKRSRANDTYFIGKVGSRQIKVPENKIYMYSKKIVDILIRIRGLDERIAHQEKSKRVIIFLYESETRKSELTKRDESIESIDQVIAFLNESRQELFDELDVVEAEERAEVNQRYLEGWESLADDQ